MSDELNPVPFGPIAPPDGEIQSCEVKKTSDRYRPASDERGGLTALFVLLRVCDSLVSWLPNVCVSSSSSPLFIGKLANERGVGMYGFECECSGRLEGQPSAGSEFSAYTCLVQAPCHKYGFLSSKPPQR